MTVENITYTGKIIAITCANCGVTYGLVDSFIKDRRQDHNTFYCPNGHSQWYPKKNEVERLTGELEAARSLAQRESRRRQLAEQNAAGERRRSAAARGQVTKIKRRVANGVCPCCKRTFADLARHMSGQHPDYVEAAGGDT